MGMNPKPTLCWDCQNSVLKGCTWHDHYEPVEGWDAEKQLVDGQISYLVKACPHFVRDAYKSGQYSTEQYIEHLEDQVTKLTNKAHRLNDIIRKLEKELSAKDGTGPKLPHKRFSENKQQQEA